MQTTEYVREAIMSINFLLILLYSVDWTLMTGKQIQLSSRGSLYHGSVKP